MTISAEGRRVIVAPVTGPVGDRIQSWREKYDPGQAQRIPPHATVLYWANIEANQYVALDAQIRHAFPEPITARLTEVKLFSNPDQTRYIEVTETDALDAARVRLFDGTHLILPEQRQTWDWHVTVVRYAIKADMAVIEPAVSELDLRAPWVIDNLLLLELQDGVYREISQWDLRR